MIPPTVNNLRLLRLQLLNDDRSGHTGALFCPVYRAVIDIFTWFVDRDLVCGSFFKRLKINSKTSDGIRFGKDNVMWVGPNVLEL